jgi:hypothetical protein
MRIVITLNPQHPGGDGVRPSPVVVEVDGGNVERQQPKNTAHAPLDGVVSAEDACEAAGAVISILLGGPHDEQVRRDIPEGEHIVEDPAFDPIGFYGLAGIDRGGGAVVQWYRWIGNDAAQRLQ